MAEQRSMAAHRRAAQQVCGWNDRHRLRNAQYVAECAASKRLREEEVKNKEQAAKRRDAEAGLRQASLTDLFKKKKP